MKSPKVAKANPQRLTHVGLGRTDVVRVDPSIIVLEKDHNPRDYTLAENREHLDELKISIKALGVLHPLTVRWDGKIKAPILVDGECRWRAVMELIAEGHPMVSVPTVQAENADPAGRLISALVANTGKPLSKWELGASFKKLVTLGHTHEMIAEKCGYGLRFITECIDLADAPPEVKKLLSAQAVTPSFVTDAMKKFGDEAPAQIQKAVDAAKRKAAESGDAPEPVRKKRVVGAGIKLNQGTYELVVAALKAGQQVTGETLDEVQKACADAIEMMETTGK